MKLTKIWAAAAAACIAVACIAYLAQVNRAEAPAVQVADVATASTSAQATVPAPQKRHAKTSAVTDGLLLVVGVIVGGACAGLLVLHLIEGPASKKEEEL